MFATRPEVQRILSILTSSTPKEPRNHNTTNTDSLKLCSINNQKQHFKPQSARTNLYTSVCYRTNKKMVDIINLLHPFIWTNHNIKSMVLLSTRSFSMRFKAADSEPNKHFIAWNKFVQSLEIYSTVIVALILCTHGGGGSSSQLSIRYLLVTWVCPVLSRLMTTCFSTFLLNELDEASFVLAMFAPEWRQHTSHTSSNFYFSVNKNNPSKELRSIQVVYLISAYLDDLSPQYL